MEEKIGHYFYHNYAFMFNVFIISINCKLC